MKVTDLRIGNCVHDIRDMYTKTQNRVHKRINMYIKIQIETIYAIIIGILASITKLIF